MMGKKLNTEWSVDVVGRMHRCRISVAQLAEACGYAPTYVSTILNNGSSNAQKFRSEEAEEATKNQIIKGLVKLEKEILDGN